MWASSYQMVHHSRFLCPHLGKIAIVVLTLVLLPVDSCILFVSCCLKSLRGSKHDQHYKDVRRQPDFKKCNVLIVGIDTSKALMLARGFYEAGQRVVGADFGSTHYLKCGWYSRSIKSYRRLVAPNESTGTAGYIRSLEDAVTQEEISIVIFCSDVTSQSEDAQAAEILTRRTSCFVSHLGAKEAIMITDPSKLAAHAVSLGLLAPETYRVNSRASVHKVLNGAKRLGKEYYIKYLGSDAQYAKPFESILPRPTLSQTYALVSQIPISSSSPWILQERIEGDSYFSQSLLVQGEIIAFAVWRKGSEQQVVFVNPKGNALVACLLKFSRRFTCAEKSRWTGFLFLEFRVHKTSTERCLEYRIIPVMGDIKFRDELVSLQGSRRKLADAHVRRMEIALRADQSSTIDRVVLTPTQYIAPHGLIYDFCTLVAVPLGELYQGHQSTRQVLSGLKAFILRLFLYCGPIFEVADPFPWWIQQHIQLPATILKSWSSERDLLSLIRC